MSASARNAFKNKYGYYFVLSLVLVGLGGMLLQDLTGNLFGGGARDQKTVASVGGENITVRDIREKKLEISRRLQGETYAMLEAQGFDFNKMALKELIEGRAIAGYAEQAGLRVPEPVALDRIASHPYFSDRATGEFSPQIYRDFLRREGLSDKQFLNEVKQTALLENVVQTVASDVTAPELVAAPVYRYVRETRDALIFTIDEKSLPGFAFSVTTAEAKAYYEKNKEKFRLPESRDFSYLHLSPQMIAQKIKPDEAELRRVYDAEKNSRYTVPEKREVYQVIFDDKKQAEATREKLRDGAGFVASLEAAGHKAEDSFLGSVTKEDLYGSSDDAVFALPAGKVSPVKKSAFGYAVYYVSKIHPAQTRSFESAKAEILKDVTERKAQTDLPKRIEEVDEFRAGGGSVKEAAEKFGAEYAAVTDVTEEGNAQTAGLPPEILRDVFSYDPGEEAPFLKKDNDYYFFTTEKTVPSAVPSFEKAEAEVKNVMRREALEKALTLYAQKIQGQIKNEGDFRSFADSLRAPIKSENLTRQSVTELSPEELTQAAFEAEPKTPAYRAFLKEQAPFVKFVFVTKAEKPKYSPDHQEATATLTRLNETMKSELTEQFIAGAKKAEGFSVNAALLSELSEREKE